MRRGGRARTRCSRPRPTGRRSGRQPGPAHRRSTAPRAAAATPTCARWRARGAQARAAMRRKSQGADSGGLALNQASLAVQRASRAGSRSPGASACQGASSAATASVRRARLEVARRADRIRCRCPPAHPTPRRRPSRDDATGRHGSRRPRNLRAARMPAARHRAARTPATPPPEHRSRRSAVRAARRGSRRTRVACRAADRPSETLGLAHPPGRPLVAGRFGDPGDGDPQQRRRRLTCRRWRRCLSARCRPGTRHRSTGYRSGC